MYTFTVTVSKKNDEGESEKDEERSVNETKEVRVVDEAK